MTESNENGIEAPESDGALLPPETVKVSAVEMPEPVKPVTPGTVPMQPIPDEVKQHARAVGGLGGPATPFEGARPQPDNALPFQAPPVVQPGAVAPAAVVSQAPVAAVTPHGGVQAHHASPRPKRPPMQLASPGLLGGAGSFHNHAHLIGAVAIGAAAPDGHEGFTGQAAAKVAQAAQQPAGFVAPSGAPVTPQASGSYADPASSPPAPTPFSAPPGTPPQIVSTSPPGRDAVPTPVGSKPDGPSGGVPAPSATAPQMAPASPMAGSEPQPEHDLAATNSPWSAEKRFEADVLPSANVLNSSGHEPAPAPPMPSSTGSSGSRMAMTVVLAIAAIGLVAAIVYFAVAGRSGDEDPASVNVGTEQREYADDPVPSGSATQAAPTPAPRPRPAFKPSPKPKSKTGDIYDDL